MGWGRSLGAWCALVALCASWVAQGQIIQSLQNSEKSTFYPSVRTALPLRRVCVVLAKKSWREVGMCVRRA